MAGIYRTMGGFKGASSKLMPLPSDKSRTPKPLMSDEEHKEWVKKIEERERRKRNG